MLSQTLPAYQEKNPLEKKSLDWISRAARIYSTFPFESGGNLQIMARRPKPEISGFTQSFFEKGKEAREFEAGDFILAKSRGLVAWLIRTGQLIRFRGKFAKWTHAALIVSKEGDLIEARGRGVVRSHLSQYKKNEYHLIRLGEMADENDRQKMVNFAEWCLRYEYGHLTILCISFCLITGSKFLFGMDNRIICSALVARALERTRLIFDKNPSFIMPADLAKYFKI